MNKSKKSIDESLSSDEESDTNIDVDDTINTIDDINEEDKEEEEEEEEYNSDDNSDDNDNLNDIISDKIINNNDNVEKEILVNSEDRVTIPILSKYEKVRLIATRAKIISEGGKPLIKNYNNLSEIEIAELELENKVIPYKIKRVLPSGKYEIWDPNIDFN